MRAVVEIMGTGIDLEPTLVGSDEHLKHAGGEEPTVKKVPHHPGTAKTSNSDYVAKTGTLTFAPGETTKTISIEVKGDSKREGNEMFYLDLFGLSSNASFTKSRRIGTIPNDD